MAILIYGGAEYLVNDDEVSKLSRLIHAIVRAGRTEMLPFATRYPRGSANRSIDRLLISPGVSIALVETLDVSFGEGEAKLQSLYDKYEHEMERDDDL
jgi:hypothetical protein